MKASLYCTVRSVDQVENILCDLRAAGFRSDEVSVLFPDQHGPRDFVHEHSNKAPEGATAGGVAGLGIGAAIGWLAGLGTLAVPGAGALIAAGPIMAALSAAAVGTTAGGIIGGLIGMGIPEFEAKLYDAKVRRGNILISIHTENSQQRSIAREILREWGADDISAGAESTPKAANW